MVFFYEKFRFIPKNIQKMKEKIEATRFSVRTTMKIEGSKEVE